MGQYATNFSPNCDINVLTRRFPPSHEIWAVPKPHSPLRLCAPHRSVYSHSSRRPSPSNLRLRFLTPPYRAQRFRSTKVPASSPLHGRECRYLKYKARNERADHTVLDSLQRLPSHLNKPCVIRYKAASTCY